MHDVGTGGAPGERLVPAFDTPSLLGIHATAPYLHDGRAAALEDLLTTADPDDRHRGTRDLSRAEREDLIVDLRSLSGE